jgi:hypothetical protein
VNNSLLEVYLENTKEYKFERISQGQVRRINLQTGQQDIISGQPNADKEYMDVPLYIGRRLKNPNHQIFGIPGSEYWYGGNTLLTDTGLDKIWAQIEARTGKKKQDHLNFPFTPYEIKKYLVVSVEDLSNEDAGELTRPVLGLPDKDGNQETIKSRKYKVDWRNTLGLSNQEKQDIENKKESNNKQRDQKIFNKSDIVKEK